MIRYVFALCIALSLFACKPSYDEALLHGAWKSNEMQFTFNPDKTLKMRLGLNDEEGTYRLSGNTIEVINKDGKVLFTLHVKNVSKDSLVINIPTMGTDRIYTLTH